MGKTSEKQEEKTIGIYLNAKDSLTIENVKKEHKMTFEEYHKIDKEGQDRGEYMFYSFMPPEGDLFYKGHSLKLKLFCVADEDGESVMYYKSTK